MSYKGIDYTFRNNLNNLLINPKIKNNKDNIIINNEINTDTVTERIRRKNNLKSSHLLWETKKISQKQIKNLKEIS